jgi:uncharacterized protein
MPDQTEPRYPVDKINRLKRRHDRGSYDHDTVHALLDAAMLCHVSYVIEGRPYCTPTLFWREGSRLYWHGSSASRMLRNLSTGEPACLAVTHLDGLVLARSGFNHSVDYRSVMAFGQARLVENQAEKESALVRLVDRFYPGRSALLRSTSKQEIKASSVLYMDIERASAKIRAIGIADDDEDYLLPIYAERVPVQTVLGPPQPCARLLPGVERPNNLVGYRAGRRLDEVLRDAHKASYPEKQAAN